MMIMLIDRHNKTVGVVWQHCASRCLSWLNKQGCGRTEDLAMGWRSVEQ